MGIYWASEEESRPAPVMRVTASENQPELGSLVSDPERLPDSPGIDDANQLKFGEYREKTWSAQGWQIMQPKFIY